MEIPKEFTDLMKRVCDENPEISIPAQIELAKELERPLNDVQDQNR